MQNKVLFFKNKIKNRIEELKPFMSDLKYKLYISMIEDCDNLEEIREMAELDLQFNMIKYVRDLDNKLKLSDTNIEELEAVANRNNRAIKLTVIAPKKKKTNRQIAKDFDFSTIGEDLEDEEMLACAANLLYMQLQNTPIEELQSEYNEEYINEDDIDSVDLDEELYDNDEEIHDNDEDTEFGNFELEIDIDEDYNNIDEDDNNIDEDYNNIDEDYNNIDEDDEIIDFGLDDNRNTEIHIDSMVAKVKGQDIDSMELDSMFEDNDEEDEQDIDSVDLDSIFEEEYNEDDEQDIDSVDLDSIFEEEDEQEEDEQDIDDMNLESMFEEEYDEEDEQDIDDVDLDSMFEEEDDDEQEDDEQDIDDMNLDSMFEEDEDDEQEEDDEISVIDSINNSDLDSIFGEDDFVEDEEDSSLDIDSIDTDSLFGDEEDDSDDSEFDIDDSEFEMNEPEEDNFEDFFNRNHNSSTPTVTSNREITVNKIFINGTRRGKQTQQMFNILGSIFNKTESIAKKAVKSTKDTIIRNRR